MAWSHPSGVATQHRMLKPCQPCLRTLLPQKLSCVIVHAGKGFGATKRSTKEDSVSSGKKAKRVNVRPPAPQLPAGMANVALQQYDALEEQKRRAEEEAEFQARLELIKLDAAQKRSTTGVGAAAAAAPARAVFDPPPPEPSSPAAAVSDDIYANPPSIMSTLQDKLQSDINDPALREAKIGPSQLGLAGGAVLFGLVFVLVSGGDFATTNRYKGIRPARPPPDPIEMSQLARQAEGFERRYEADRDDVQSLEAAAVTYARMQDYATAAELLDELTSVRPDDVEAWRLLGESRLLNADAAKSVSAYEKAIALSPNNQTIITGLVDAYVANSQQAKAVKYLTDLRDSILAQLDTKQQAAAETSAVSDATAVATAAAMPSSDGTTTADATSSSATASSSSSESAADSGAASSSDRVAVDPIAVQLLLGKSYAAWRGHDQDALAAYDTLIGAFPTDFRGYLAKGMLLRDRGRQGDAERMFLQAKFYAPDNMQAFVASRAGERADIGPLPDNGLE